MSALDQTSLPEPTPPRLTVRAIAAIVAEEFGVVLSYLLSDRRTQDIIEPRQVLMWLAHRHTGSSLPQIGRALGGRDHTTVLHGSRTIEARRRASPEMAARLDKLTALVGLAEAGLRAQAQAPAPAPVEVQVIVREPTPAQQKVLDALAVYLTARDALVAQTHTPGEAAARREAERTYLLLRRAYAALRDDRRPGSAAA